jgi:glycosyltransferase involved in cell wall biosynthesis
MTSVMTFTGKISGLKAASLHAQYFEEYMAMAKHLEHLTVVTDTVEYIPPDIPQNLTIIKLPKIKIPKIYGLTKVLFYSIPPIIDRQVDVVYVRTFSPPELTSLWLAKKVRNKKTVLTLGGTWLFGKPFEKPTLKKRLFRWILRRAAYSADIVTIYSKYMLPEIKYFLPSIRVDKIRIIHNAVNIKRFRPGLPPPPIMSDGLKTVLWVGRITEDKGVGELIRAFKIILEKNRDTKLIIGGTGAPSYVESLKRKCVDLNINDRVIFTGGIPNESVPNYMANCSVFVYPSRGGEGIPRALLEAMACAAPVVATDVSGIPEAVEHMKTGLIVKPQDVQQLSTTINIILEDERLARNLGLRAREKIEREFSYDVVIPQIAKVLKDVAENDSETRL